MSDNHVAANEAISRGLLNILEVVLFDKDLSAEYNTAPRSFAGRVTRAIPRLMSIVGSLFLLFGGLVTFIYYLTIVHFFPDLGFSDIPRLLYLVSISGLVAFTTVTATALVPGIVLAGYFEPKSSQLDDSQAVYYWLLTGAAVSSLALAYVLTFVGKQWAVAVFVAFMFAPLAFALIPCIIGGRREIAWQTLRGRLYRIIGATASWYLGTLFLTISYVNDYLIQVKVGVVWQYVALALALALYALFNAIVVTKRLANALVGSLALLLVLFLVDGRWMLAMPFRMITAGQFHAVVYFTDASSKNEFVTRCTAETVDDFGYQVEVIDQLGTKVWLACTPKPNIVSSWNPDAGKPVDLYAFPVDKTAIRLLMPQ